MSEMKAFSRLPAMRLRLQRVGSGKTTAARLISKKEFEDDYR